MKKLLISTVVLTSVLTMAACAADDEGNSSEDQHNQDVESQPVISQTDMGDKMSELSYTVYDFDVLYEESEFEGEIENDEGLIEAEFYNPFSDITARGSDAFEAIFPVLQELELNPDMDDEEAITESLAAFDLPDNYLKAQLEVVFSDGTEKTYEIKK
ncbi:YusW family protein [Ornithinibacillus salinisoli]|uniref:YusW family protein n=1 Tax=Ornithinibacillus salinisoli TaxID=1848459 RepID=A0ABW4W288_9BACI